MGITLQRTRLGCHLPRSLLWIYSRCLILRRMLRQWMGRALLALRRGYSNLGYRMDRRLASDGSLSVIYLSASFSLPSLSPYSVQPRISSHSGGCAVASGLRASIFILPMYISYYLHPMTHLRFSCPVICYYRCLPLGFYVYHDTTCTSCCLAIDRNRNLDNITLSLYFS